MIGQTEITTLFIKMTFARSSNKATYTTYSALNIYWIFTACNKVIVDII